MKIALGIEYDGANYQGWQSQASRQTLQDAIEAALSVVADQRVVVHAAGRTDAGVHATLMVANFDTSVFRQPSAWVNGTNTQLPPSIRLLWARPVAADFHARHGASRRYYQYLLHSRSVRSAILRQYAGSCHVPLDIEAMRQAAQFLIGRHDFSSFRAAACQAASPIRHLFALRISQSGDFIIFDFCGASFLHRMVRNIMGALIDVGRQRQSPQWISTLLSQRDRQLSSPPVVAAGLYFSGALYDSRFHLPDSYRPAPLIGECVATMQPADSEMKTIA